MGKEKVSIKDSPKMETAFSDAGIDFIREIVRDELHCVKERDTLLELVKKRRHYTKLAGHIKISSERKCGCGEPMLKVNSGVKSGGWACPKEEKEWDYIIYKLSGREQ